MSGRWIDQSPGGDGMTYLDDALSSGRRRERLEGGRHISMGVGVPKGKFFSMNRKSKPTGETLNHDVKPIHGFSLLSWRNGQQKERAMI
jgi:hypothetical protein